MFTSIRSTPPRPPDDAVATARGWLALALERCWSPSDAALALCAAWDELDLTGSVGLIEPTRPARLDASKLVGRARAALRGAATSAPAEHLLPIARALDHLDAAAALIRLEESCDGEPWA
jgi:hypothetical protein